MVRCRQYTAVRCSTSRYTNSQLELPKLEFTDCMHDCMTETVRLEKLQTTLYRTFELFIHNVHTYCRV
jgi:hypothetical protein